MTRIVEVRGRYLTEGDLLQRRAELVASLAIETDASRLKRTSEIIATFDRVIERMRTWPSSSAQEQIA